jgi:hypothetical protein
MAGICRPLSPLNLAAFSKQQLSTYAKALQPLLSSFNELPSLKQHNGLNYNGKFCRPFPTQEFKTMLTFPNSAIVNVERLLYLSKLCQPCRPRQNFRCRSLSLGLCRPLFPPFIASRFCERLPTFASH